MNYDNELSPVWLGSIKKHTYPLLARDMTADVAVIGGGIVGLLTAHLLTAAGQRVVVLEAGRIAEGESGRSTGQLSSMSDALPHELIRSYNTDTAHTVFSGLQQGIALISATVASLGISCNFQHVPGYLFAAEPEQVALLGDVAKACRELGLPCAADRPDAPAFPALAALRFSDQAQLDPVQFLQGLADQLTEQGVAIFEHTRVITVTGNAPLQVVTEAGPMVAAQRVVVAAHVPFHTGLWIHTKQTTQRTYVSGLKVPRQLFPTGLFRQCGPVHHAAVVHRLPRHDLLLVMGEEHKTGEMRTDESNGMDPFQALSEYARLQLRMPGELLCQWSGQLLHPADSLPLIGENPSLRGEFLATGLGRNGLAAGALAAHIMTERILGRSTVWDGLYSPGRFVTHGVKDFLAENVGFASHLIGDRLRPAGEERQIGTLHSGEGAIFKLGNRRLAVSRLDNGRFVALSPLCTHSGCQVRWNGAERSWDSPCHGSRYSRTGDVINGPAVKPLAAVPLEEALDAEERSLQLKTALRPDTADAFSKDWVVTT